MSFGDIFTANDVTAFTDSWNIISESWNGVERIFTASVEYDCDIAKISDDSAACV
ncbi:MAG: hypothetical protein SGCHY_005536, partial [Lobulomycetales sp.]